MIVDGFGRTQEGFAAIAVRTYDEDQMGATGEPLVINFDRIAAITVF